MKYRGLIFPILIFVLVSGNVAIAQGFGGSRIPLNFSFVESDDSVVKMSMGKEKAVSVFSDTNGDGLFDTVRFDNHTISSHIDVDDALGFSFEDGSKLAFFPTRLRELPKQEHYEIVGFLVQWGDFGNRTLALLAYQAKNYETSDGISVYLVDRAGVRIGAMFHMFMDKSMLRVTAPYQKWMSTGEDFAVGTSTKSSDFVVIGKDLGLLDSVMIVNISLNNETKGSTGGFDIRASEPDVVKEALNLSDQWNLFGAEGESGVFSSVKIGNKTVSADISAVDASGFEYPTDQRYAVFYPSDISTLPKAPASGINWEVLGFVHYFDDEQKINTMLAVLIGQVAGDDTTKGTRVMFINNAGHATGVPRYEFVPRRSVKLIDSFSVWEESGNDWCIGFQPKVEHMFYLAKDLGIVEKVLLIQYQWY